MAVELPCRGWAEFSLWKSGGVMRGGVSPCSDCVQGGGTLCFGLQGGLAGPVLVGGVGVGIVGSPCGSVLVAWTLLWSSMGGRIPEVGQVGHLCGTGVSYYCGFSCSCRHLLSSLLGCWR